MGFTQGINSSLETAGEVVGVIVDGVKELFPKKINTSEEVKQYLVELGQDATFRDGDTIVTVWGSAEWRDDFAVPNALENHHYFKLRQSIKAGRRAIRSSRVIEVLDFSSYSGDVKDGFVVNVPIGFGTEIDTRYFRGEGSSLRLDIAARAIYEASAGIDGSRQLAQLKEDQQAHARWVADHSDYFGEAARQRDREKISAVSADLAAFQEETGLDPINDPFAFIQWVRKQ